MDIIFFSQNKLVTPSEVINFHIDFYALSDFQLVWLTACQDWRKGYSMKLYKTAVQKKKFYLSYFKKLFSAEL